MLTEARKHLRLLGFYFKYNLAASMEYRAAFISQVMGMAINNSSFIIFWWVLFQRNTSIGGYSFNEVMIIWAVVAAAYGIAMVLFGNLNSLVEIIMNGELDTYLLQPKDVLLNAVASKTVISAWGDFFYGVILFMLTQKPTAAGLGMFFLFSVLGALIFSAIMIIVSSLAFHFGSVQGLRDMVFMFMISFSTYPEGIYKGFVRFVIYTALPAAYMAFVPARLFRGFSLPWLLLMLGAALVYVCLAYTVFYNGIKKYESGNLITTRM